MKSKILVLSLTFTGMLLLLGGATYYLLFTPFTTSKSYSYIYIDTDDTQDSIIRKVETAGQPKQMLGFKIAAWALDYNGNIRPGRYEVGGELSAMQLIRRLRSGDQAPIRIIIPNVRTMNDIAARLGKHLAADSSSLITAFNDSSVCREYGCTVNTLSTLFIPNTYEVYWTTTPKQLLERMKKESDKYWTAERRQKAANAGLTPQEVIILASIVDQETAAVAEKADVAGLYLNRLKKDMLLQADPTVKYALKQFGLRRILHEHLTVESPYNTYKYKGLPPGPICIPAISSIEAVLNFRKHDYIYMCAKEDFSGYHNFAATYQEHLRNAKRYTQALNKRNIR